jgi:cysteine desulfurase
MRSGTLYTPQIVGFAKAVELGLEEQVSESERLTQLRQRLWQQLSQLEGIYINGHPTQRLSGNLNISVEGIDGSALLLGLQPVVAVSSGAACSSVNTDPSHVLMALGHSEALAYASIRFGIGRFNTVEEIDRVAQHAIATIESLRQSQIVTSKSAQLK